MLCPLNFSEQNCGQDREKYVMMTVPQQVTLKVKTEDNAKHSPFENPVLFRSIQGQSPSAQVLLA